MVFKCAFNTLRSQAEGQRVQITQIGDQQRRSGAYIAIQQRPRHRRRRRVHQQQRRIHILGRSGHRLHPRHDGRNILSGKSKGRKLPVRLHPPGDILKTKLAIRDIWRSIAVIKHRHRHRRQVIQRYAKFGKSVANGVKVKISQRQPQHIVWQFAGFIFADHLNTFCLQIVEIIIEGTGGSGRGVQFMPRFEVVFRRPMAGTAAHGDAGQQHRPAGAGGRLQPAAHDHGG